MKFTLSWLKEHLETDATVDEVVAAMTMAGLEVEHVDDPAAKLAAFSVAKVVEAVQHPNADRLRVCQVDTKDGLKEIVCGAPNARPGLTTIYAPLGAYVPGSGITLEARPVRGVVSNGMLCSAKELEIAEESDGILELSDALQVGASAAEAFGLEAVIDFEVTPNRPDWLGVRGIARDLAAAGLGTLKPEPEAGVPGSGITLEARPVRGVVSNGMLCSAKELEIAEESDGIVELSDALQVGASAAEAFGLEAVIDFEVTPNRPDWLGVRGIARDLAAAGLGTLKPEPEAGVPGSFPCPIEIRVDGDACRVFAGRLIRGLKNGPSPAWLQQRLTSVGLRPINALVDITNLISYDRARPLHVYDHALLVGQVIEARLGRGPGQPGPEGEPSPAKHVDEQLIALDGKTYDITPEMCVIADADGQRPIGLGGVMGGESTGCSEATTEVFVESAWFDPIRTAQTGRVTGITSDAQYRFARGVDPQSVVPGLELATKLILEICGGEASEIGVAGEAPAPPRPIAFDRTYVKKLSGLAIPPARIDEILGKLGFAVTGGEVTPPSWRRDVEGPADLVEEVARIEGYDALPAEPLPPVAIPPSGVLTTRQARMRAARRALAARGYAEAVTWSFLRQDWAGAFGGGQPELVLANPIASDLSTMRPSILPNLAEAAARNARKGFADLALFEIGPTFKGDGPGDQLTVIAGLVAAHAPRRWDRQQPDALFALKADLMALLEEIGAPPLQTMQGQASPWWHPGRSARLQLGPKTVVAEFGELHPRVLKLLDAAGPLYGFEINLDTVPEPKKKAVKTRPALELSPLMPLSRDFAFVVAADTPAGELVRPILGADKQLVADARVFDVYQGPGVPEGSKSVAVEVTVQPREKTLTDAEIEALSAKIVAAAEKAVGAKLRS